MGAVLGTVLVPNPAAVAAPLRSSARREEVQFASGEKVIWRRTVRMALADDGTQGYTPYFYKMDVPVRVRRSISYGRAWQMLRSRGAGSNLTGPCDPPQLASSCNCSSPNGSQPFNGEEHPLPRCVASALCGGGSSSSSTLTTPRSPSSKATILLVLDVNKANLRFPLGGNVRKAYGKMVREIIRLCVSLALVKNTLPVTLLASGERSAAAEAALASRFGLTVIGGREGGVAPPTRVPAWASKWARGSFAKLRALTLTQYERLLMLDSDMIALRNLDHLPWAVTPPAFVYGWKCYPRREMRAATMVLRPSDATYEDAMRLLEEEGTAVYDDLGEQSVWRRLYSRESSSHGPVSELPAGYCAMRTADFSADEWRKVHLLHDAHLIHDYHRPGWEAAGMGALVGGIDREATRIFNAEFARFFEGPTKRGRQRGGRRRRGNGG